MSRLIFTTLLALSLGNVFVSGLIATYKIFASSSSGADYFRLSAKGRNLAINRENSTIWRVIEFRKGYWVIQNADNGLVIKRESRSNNKVVLGEPDWKNLNQRWIITRKGSIITLDKVTNSHNFALEVNFEGNVYLAPYNGNFDQRLFLLAQNVECYDCYGRELIEEPTTRVPHILPSHPTISPKPSPTPTRPTHSTRPTEAPKHTRPSIQLPRSFELPNKTDESHYPNKTTPTSAPPSPTPSFPTRRTTTEKIPSLPNIETQSPKKIPSLPNIETQSPKKIPSLPNIEIQSPKKIPPPSKDRPTEPIDCERTYD